MHNVFGKLTKRIVMVNHKTTSREDDDVNCTVSRKKGAIVFWP